MLAATVLLVCAAPSRGAVGDSLTVDKAIALVLRNHPALQRAAQQVEASQALVGVSQSSFYPDVSGSGFYNRIGPVPTISIPGEGRGSGKIGSRGGAGQGRAHKITTSVYHGQSVLFDTFLAAEHHRHRRPDRKSQQAS